MEAFILIAVVFSLGIFIGHVAGYDKGVQTTEQLVMLRQAFHRPMLRGRDKTWRVP